MVPDTTVFVSWLREEALLGLSCAHNIQCCEFAAVSAHSVSAGATSAGDGRGSLEYPKVACE